MTHETQLRPASPEALAEIVHQATGRVVIEGGGSKPALLPRAAPGDLRVSTRRLEGIVAYVPSEYTLTAAAGTPVAAIDLALAEHGQYLPFDPPFAERGATLGGALACGLAGPGRIRFGGVRDFVLEVRYVDGRGRLLRAGARVVKNAAGFDVPKLLVGSLGRLAAIAEITIKVLPRPQAYASERFELPTPADTHRALARILARPFDLEGLELLPPRTLLVRVGGPRPSLDSRLDRVGKAIGARGERLPDDLALWRHLSALDDLANGGPADGEPGRDLALIKVPATPSRIIALEKLCEAAGYRRRYSAGAAMAWIALPSCEPEIEAADRALRSSRLSGVLIRGPKRADPRLGDVVGDRFLHRVAAALDPGSTFPAFAPRAA